MSLRLSGVVALLAMVVILRTQRQAQSIGQEHPENALDENDAWTL